MPSPGFRRSLPLLDLSPAESTQIRIDPERELAARQLASEAAKAGALGAPVAGNLGRSMISYEDWLRGIQSQPLVFRGLSRPVDSPLEPRPGYAAFASNNPSTALTYSGDPSNLDAKPVPVPPGAAVHPIRLSPSRLNEFDKGSRFDKFAFDEAARRVRPGEAIVARGVNDGGPRDVRRGARTGSWAQDTYSWANPEGVATAVSSPLGPEGVQELLERAATRAGLDGKKFSGESDYPRQAGVGPWPESERITREELDRVLMEIPKDPTFLPTRKARAAQFLKGMAKEALRPKNIITDALIGSQVGAASALAGYEAGRPRATQVFNLPGEYRQALSQEGLLAQIEAKAAQKEALRQQYIDEVNATYGEGTLQPGARIEEIRDYLGPVRGLQGR
jgi:hypothetical protein